MRVGNREVGPAAPVFIVAEISCNHAGELRHALALVDAAAEAGADAVKFQFYTPAELTRNSQLLAYRLNQGVWYGRRLWDLYEEAQTPWEWLPALAERAAQVGLPWFASAFSAHGMRRVLDAGSAALKIASGESVDPEFVAEAGRLAAEYGVPVIVSLGMTPLGDGGYVFELADLLSRAPAAAMLFCVADYPARTEHYELRHWAIPVDIWGVSDHTTTPELAVRAVRLGAHILEHHLMLSPSDYGHGRPPLDAKHSFTPAEFGQYVYEVRGHELAIRSRPARRLVYTRALPAGHRLRQEDLASFRATEGLYPLARSSVDGRVLRVPVVQWQPVRRDHFEEG